MLTCYLIHAPYSDINKPLNDVKESANPNSQSSLLQLRARDFWQQGCATLNPAKA